MKWGKVSNTFLICPDKVSGTILSLLQSIKCHFSPDFLDDRCNSCPTPSGGLWRGWAVKTTTTSGYSIRERVRVFHSVGLSELFWMEQLELFVSFLEIGWEECLDCHFSKCFNLGPHRDTHYTNVRGPRATLQTCTNVTVEKYTKY